MTDLIEVAALIRRTNALIEVLVKTQLRAVMDKELADPRKRKLYELTGGPTPIRELSQQIGMGTGPISETWQRWEECGLVVKDGKKYRRLFE